jgi:hypothetical protein
MIMGRQVTVRAGTTPQGMAEGTTSLLQFNWDFNVRSAISFIFNRYGLKYQFNSPKRTIARPE